VHLNTGQYAAAFNYFSAAINLRPSFAHTYMYLGITLARLGDMDNACQSYQRALDKEKSEPVFHLNFGMLHLNWPVLAMCSNAWQTMLTTLTHAAITLLKGGRVDEAKKQLAAFQDIYEDLDEQSKNADPEINEQAALLQTALTQM
jgi:Bardet-Biedl syndrome 4 protein